MIKKGDGKKKDLKKDGKKDDRKGSAKGGGNRLSIMRFHGRNLGSKNVTKM